MKKEIKIIDESGDRKYYTQIPNLVINHSTAYEQSLYLIMKRRAGEFGSCYESLNSLSKKMGISKNTVSKTIEKLLERKWIKEIDEVIVSGGKVRQFSITDLWSLNIKEYEGGNHVTTFRKGGNHVTRGGHVVRTKNNQEEEPIIAAPAAEVFDFNSYLQGMRENKQRHIQVIALFWDRTNRFYENREQAQAAITRNIRTAKGLVGYDDGRINETIDYIELQDFLEDKWTLETVAKYIDNPKVANKQNSQYARIQ